MKKSNIMKKHGKLKQVIKEKKGMAIAFSGGVDSSLIAKIAYDVLGKKTLAVTLTSETFSKRELRNAKRIAKEIGIPHIVVKSSEIHNDKFIKNPENRCYYCKKEEASVLKRIANEKGIKYIADGVNLSDFNEHRPGIKALNEQGFIHPLVEAGIKKCDVKYLAKMLSLSNWDMSSTTCLASRIPYNEKITKEKLKRIEEAESFILSSGFKQVRVRSHGDIARIEVSKDEIEKFTDTRIQKKVANKLRKIGFRYVTVDLEGYRSGSMDEVL